jgi:phosphate:Na+ symporter
MVFLASSSPMWQHLSRVTVGLGLMILALSLIVGSSETLRHSHVLSTVIAPLSHDHILALLLAVALTWVCHSSVAVVLLVMSFVVTQVVPVELGVVMVIGANLGSGIVPLILGLSESPRARRIPLGNLLFRVAAAVVVLPFVGLIAPYLSLLESDPARQIANFHTLFNLVMVPCALPLVVMVARLTERVFPGDAEKDDPQRPKYLNPKIVDKPAEAIACAVRESLRMADTVETMLRGAIDVFPSNDAKLLDRVSRLDDEVDALHEAIKIYVTRINRHCVRDEDRIRCAQVIDFTTNLEHIGDIIDKNLLEVAQQKIDDKATFSEAGWQELVKMHALLMKQMRLAMSAFIGGEEELARKLLAGKRRVREMERRGNMLHFARLQSEQIESLETSGLHLDILRDFKRIDSHLASIAYSVLEANRQRETRLLEPADAEADAETAGECHDDTVQAKKG